MHNVVAIGDHYVRLTIEAAFQFKRDHVEHRHATLTADEQHWTIHPAQGVAAQRHHVCGAFGLQLESHFRAGAHQLRTHFKWQAIEASFSENPIDKAPHAVFEIAVLEGGAGRRQCALLGSGFPESCGPPDPASTLPPPRHLL